MEVPTWAYDEVLAFLKPTELKVALALYRHGSPQVSREGTRRAYWRGSKDKLAATARVTKRALDAALGELIECGIVIEHNVSKANGGVAFSALYDHEGGAKFAPPLANEAEAKPPKMGAKFAPPFRFKNAHHGGVKDPDPDPEKDLVNTIMVDRGAKFAPPSEADELVERMWRAGVNDPERWFDEFARDDVAAAFDLAESDPAVRSVGAFARYLLRQGYEAPEPEPEPFDPFEARHRKFLGGSLGKFIRSGLEDETFTNGSRCTLTTTGGMNE